MINGFGLILEIVVSGFSGGDCLKVEIEMDLGSDVHSNC